jgi:signal transduction histidine kinase
VFANLIGNAVEAVGPGGTIQLHVFPCRDRRDSGQQGVRVVVADDGPGIAPLDRNRIFEPFFTTKGEKGTGLGLWVVNGIVQKHGGRVRLRSSTRPGRSFTCFSIFLPDRTAGYPLQVGSGRAVA